MTLENYKNGKLEGLRTCLLSQSKIAEEITYKNGLKKESIKNTDKTEFF